jgi:hypothetical protein
MSSQSTDSVASARQFVVPVVLAAILFAVVTFIHLSTPPSGPILELAEAFANGQLYAPGDAVKWDSSPFDGKIYWPYGPLPSVVLAPWMWFGLVPQAALSLGVIGGVFMLCFFLAKRLGYPSEDGCWFALAFTFGSSFVNTLPFLGGLSTHAVAVLLLFAAILEYEGRRRLLLVSLFVGLAMASRVPAGLNIVLFLTLSIVDKNVRYTLETLVPFVGVAILLALYNYARFENPFEAGYSYQIHGPSGLPYSALDIPGNRSGPTLALSNIPGNLWTMLFGLPDVRAIGSSVFLVSPYLPKLFSGKWDRTNTLIAVNCGLVLFAVLSFRNSGFEQVGYRFSLDFLPILFWMAMRSKVEMSKRFKVLITAAIIIDAALLVYYLGTGLERRALFSLARSESGP